jgi:hypothetical protein
LVATADTRILDSIIKGIVSEEEDPLTALIDEYLIKRNLPKYRDRRIKKIVIDLEDRPRPGGRLSPSSICGCERQAALKFIGVDGVKRLDPDTELIFEDGHWRHHKWGYLFQDMEKVLGRKRFRVINIEYPVVLGPLFVAGHLDIEVKIKVNGKWIRYVIDFKGSNSWSYTKAYQNNAPDETYVKQLMTYMRGRKCHRGMLLYESKDRNVFNCFVVTFNEKEWAKIRRWCRRVIDQLERKKLPPKHPECNKGTFLYGRCQFKGLCFGNLTDRQLERQVYVDFPGVSKAWAKGHKEIEEHGGYEV